MNMIRCHVLDQFHKALYDYGLVVGKESNRFRADLPQNGVMGAILKFCYTELNRDYRTIG